MAALFNLDAYHVVASDEVGVQGGVHTLAAVNESACLVYSDAITLSPVYLLGTDDIDPPSLPCLTIEAKTGIRISSDSGMELPGIWLDARFGSRLSKRLPDLGVSASGSHETLASVDATLPAASLSASTGARSKTLSLPDLGLTATAQGGLLGRLDKRLPGVFVSATGYRDGTASLVADLPPLTLSISMGQEVLISLARDLPTLRIAATGGHARTMTLDALLPCLSATATGRGGTISLDAYIPTLLPGGEAGGNVSLLVNRDIYEDYVLRHVR